MTKHAFGLHADGMQSEHHVPLPSAEQNLAFSQSADRLGPTRGRSESDGYRTLSARSSDDRAPLSTFFDNQAWQRMSSALPAGVRDPLNIDELEREERLMPYTQMAVGEMGASPLRIESISAHTSVVPATASQRASGMSRYAAASQGTRDISEKPGQAIDWAYMQDHNLRTGGLPSLDQVLTRRTRAPLALRDFAVHCSVRQPQARRWLEFYMAARTHEKMCLAYESDLRHAKARSQYGAHDSHVLPAVQSQRTSRYDDAHDKADPARRAAAHNATIESLSRGGELLVPEDSVRPLTDLQDGGAPDDAFRRSRRQSSRMALQIQTAAETIFMRYFRAALDPNLAQGMGGFWQGGGTSSAAAEAVARAQSGHSNRGHGKIGSLKRMLTQKPSAGSGGSRGLNQLQPTLDDPYHQGYGITDSVYGKSDPRVSAGNSMYDNVHGQLGSTASLNMSREYLNTPITPDVHTGSQQQQQQQPRYLSLTQGTSRGLGGAFGSSRHHLYYHMPWPPEILTNIEQRLLHDGAALDHSLFSEALLYAYDVLDTYYFPIFIADAVSRNVTRDHCVLRVFIAFLLLWFGFALPLALILLDHEPKAERIWSILPQLLGWWNMAVGFGGCDPLLAVMRKYQSPTMKDVSMNPTAKKERPKWTLRGKLDDWHRAWFSTRVSVDMTATRMVRARSIRWFIGALVMTGISTAILCAVPGTRIYRN
ncbi:hypothetical protein IWW55_003828 [Coemansia sp. RSA 2706]|nr:hypothetical protein IWW55_003828 [Coemansia sp. RSA 2706]KAJ2367822.1 hypothetical protein H4S01_001935 [Coemansia sp. RSA 2610]KAJ2738175.1 Bud site selection protein, Revert to axial protein 1 [Coemansia sp. Cherry 401B]